MYYSTIYGKSYRYSYNFCVSFLQFCLQLIINTILVLRVVVKLDRPMARIFLSCQTPDTPIGPARAHRCRALCSIIVQVQWRLRDLRLLAIIYNNYY